MHEVIVIGGGIAGCSTAYYLASDGVGTVLMEQSEINAHASGANAGSLHAQIQPEPFATRGRDWARTFSPALRFYADAIGLWMEAGELLGVDLEVEQNGGLTVATSQEEMRLLQAKAEIERAAGLAVEEWSATDLRERASWISQRMQGAVFCPIEGKANPMLAAPAYAAAAEAAGARILRGQRVRAIRKAGSGYELRTDRETLHARRVVNAAGMRTDQIASLLGIGIDTQSFPIQLSVTEPAAPLIRHLVYSGSERLTLKQARNGSILIGGGWPAQKRAGGQTAVCRSSLADNLRVAIRLVPEISTSSIVRTWSAEVNGNQSWLPLIGEVPGSPGFFLNYVPWMGFSGGPAASRIVASLVQGQPPPCEYDISSFLP